MKTRIYFKKLVSNFLLGFLLTIAACLFAAENEITIVGTVTAWEWDDDNNVTAVAISVEDEDYVVGENDLGKELLELVDHDVEATGTVTTTENDEKIIMVTEYSDFGVVESEGDEELEPEEN